MPCVHSRLTDTSRQIAAWRDCDAAMGISKVDPAPLRRKLLWIGDLTGGPDGPPHSAIAAENRVRWADGWRGQVEYRTASATASLEATAIHQVYSVLSTTESRSEAGRSDSLDRTHTTSSAATAVDRSLTTNQRLQPDLFLRMRGRGLIVTRGSTYGEKWRRSKQGHP
jgi:hypothetical protein